MAILEVRRRREHGAGSVSEGASCSEAGGREAGGSEGGGGEGSNKGGGSEGGGSEGGGSEGGGSEGGGSNNGGGGVGGRGRSSMRSQRSSQSGKRLVSFSHPPASGIASGCSVTSAEEEELRGWVTSASEAADEEAEKTLASFALCRHSPPEIGAGLRKLTAKELDKLSAQIDAEESQVRLERAAMRKILAKS